MKRFNTIKGEVIPPKSEDDVSIRFNFSDEFIAKAELSNGDIKNTLVRYDFNKNRWSSIKSGLKKVIEYYTEVNGFVEWMETQNKLCLETHLEIYNAFDEEDKYSDHEKDR